MSTFGGSATEEGGSSGVTDDSATPTVDTSFPGTTEALPQASIPTPALTLPTPVSALMVSSAADSSSYPYVTGHSNSYGAVDKIAGEEPKAIERTELTDVERTQIIDKTEEWIGTKYKEIDLLFPNRSLQKKPSWDRQVRWSILFAWLIAFLHHGNTFRNLPSGKTPLVGMGPVNSPIVKA